MKALAIMLISVIAPLLWGSEIPDAIKGTWVVTGYRFAGTSKVHEYEIKGEDGKPWVEPGSVLLTLSDTGALAVWDGVFFVLKRKLPNQSSALDARTALGFHIEDHWPGARESER